MRRGIKISNGVSGITSFADKACHHLFRPMNHLSQADLLCKLQAQLQHFESSPDFGDAEAVAVIRRHLLVRIREAESGLRCSLIQKGPVPHAEAA